MGAMSDYLEQRLIDEVLNIVAFAGPACVCPDTLAGRLSNPRPGDIPSEARPREPGPDGAKVWH